MFANVVCGNALHIPLPDKSVQCVVTSPPYWGLRDYGTAKWEGGYPECEHIVGEIRTGKGMALLGEQYRGGGIKASTFKPLMAKHQCPHCGALRIDNQLGMESTPEEYVANMVQVFRDVWRVLRDDGTLWLNLGDSYAGSWGNYSPNTATPSDGWSGNRFDRRAYDDRTWRPPNSKPQQGLKSKDLIGIPWRVAFALQADGWYLRSDIIWHKPNPMPESVTDRPTSAHEYLFLMSKSERYYYDNEAIKEPCKSGPSDIKKMIEKKDRIGGNKHKALIDPLAKASSATNIGRKRGVGSPTGRNKRSVWTIATRSYPGAHFATFPPALVEPCILAGTSAEGQCSVCGAPMQRIVDKEFVPQEDVSLEHGVRGNGGQKPMDASNSWGNVPRGSNKTTTVAWAHGCNCDSDTVPQLVMDPFAGTGTVGQVAIKHGRSFVGVELSMDYIGLAQKRLHCLPVAMF